MAKRKKIFSLQDVGDVMTTETASIISDYIRQYVGVAMQPSPGSGVFMNPDRVLRTQTYQEVAWYDLYAEVEKDPHISAILQTRKMKVAGKEWRIEPHDLDDTKQVEIAEFIESKLSELENFNQDIYELLDGISKGFSVSEIVWERGADKSIFPVKLMNRPQRRFQFDAVTRQLKLRNIENPYLGDPLPEMKFICHRGASVWENPFGDALDQRLYWMWMFKKTVLTFWMKKNEVDMSCVPLVKHPANANDTMKTEAMEIAQSLRVGAYGRIPANFEIIWAESSKAAGSADQYGRFIELCNGEMTKATLGQTLTTEGSAPGGAGSKALGSVHNEVRGDIESFDTMAIEGTLNSTLIRWIVDLNYGEQEHYPKFRFGSQEVDDLTADIDMVTKLSAAGYKATQEWVSERFDIELEEPQPAPSMEPGVNPMTGEVTEEVTEEATEEATEGETETEELDEEGNPVEFGGKGSGRYKRGSKLPATLKEFGKAGKPAAIATVKYGGPTTMNSGGKGRVPKEGYPVATFPKLSHVVEAKDYFKMSAKEKLKVYTAYVAGNSKLLKSGKYGVGTWFDKKDKKIWFDVVTVVKDLKTAKALGAKHNQKAVYGIKENKEFPTGGTGL